MQSSSYELSTLVSGKEKCKKKKESYNIMPYISRADVYRLMAEQYDAKSNESVRRVRSH